MIWLQSAALAGLAAVAIPALVHLLVRRRAPRVLFPSLRFLLPTATIAIRLRAISDWPLLLIRMSLVALAALAFAQPLIVTAQRRAVWNTRYTRAIIVDTSASMTFGRGTPDAATAAGTEAGPTAGRALAALAAIAERTRKESWRHRVIETTALRSGLEEAIAHLGHEPPARREIVVVSDFQQGALTDRDLRSVPPTIGVRFERTAAVPTDRTALGWPLLLRDAAGMAPWVPLVYVDAEGTRVTYQRLDEPPPPKATAVRRSNAKAEASRDGGSSASPRGLSVDEGDGQQRRVRIDRADRPTGQMADADQMRPLHPGLPITFLVSQADRAAADALLPLAAGVGVPQVQSPDWRAFIALGGASSNEEPVRKAVRPTGWVADVLARLAVDRDLRDIAAQIDVESAEAQAGTEAGSTNSITEDGTWTTMVRDRSGAAIVHGAATLSGDASAAAPTLLLVTNARASSFFALALTHAVLRAMGAGISLTESEVASIPDTDLARWTRAAPEVTEESLRHADDTDARWLWTAVLVLLGVETIVRRGRKRTMATEEDRRAA